MTYAFHSQQYWLDRALSGSAPLWLSVAFLGYAWHTANGHATFPKGEIGRLLGVDADTGELDDPKPSNRVSEAIGRAVEEGFLAAGSGARCLVMPYPGIWQGPGQPDEPCPVHRLAGTAARRAADLIRGDPTGHARYVCERQRFLRMEAQRREHDFTLTGAGSENLPVLAERATL